MNSAYFQISAQTDSFNFLDQIYPKIVFLVEKRKSEDHHGILRIWISLSTKFQLKLTIWVFGPNLGKKVTEQNNQSNKLQAFAFCIVKINSTIVFEYFEDLKNLIILNILKEKLGISCLLA